MKTSVSVERDIWLGTLRIGTSIGVIEKTDEIASKSLLVQSYDKAAPYKRMLFDAAPLPEEQCERQSVLGGGKAALRVFRV